MLKQVACVREFVVLLVLLGSSLAPAQESPDGAGGDSPPKFVDPAVFLGRGPADGLELAPNCLPNILLTGYWPPTNEMLRQFSKNLAQNPGGWVGENWEGRGYNIYAFFPEFPGGTGVNPKGDGDFEVDYQVTSNHWWPLVEKLRPTALITFSRANTVNGWEMEGGNRTYPSASWTADYLVPLRPTPELPIYNEPALNVRWSSLPMNLIVAEVSASGANVAPFIEPIDSSRFLSNYIGYHGNWYRDLFADPLDPYRCYAAGHIHVGASTQLAAAVLATEVTVRTLIAHVDGLRPAPGDLDRNGMVEFSDLERLIAVWFGPDQPRPDEADEYDFRAADVNGDCDVDLADLALVQPVFTGP